MGPQSTRDRYCHSNLPSLKVDYPTDYPEIIATKSYLRSQIPHIKIKM